MVFYPSIESSHSSSRLAPDFGAGLLGVASLEPGRGNDGDGLPGTGRGTFRAADGVGSGEDDNGCLAGDTVTDDEPETACDLEVGFGACVEADVVDAGVACAGCALGRSRMDTTVRLLCSNRSSNSWSFDAIFCRRGWMRKKW